MEAPVFYNGCFYHQELKYPQSRYKGNLGGKLPQFCQKVTEIFDQHLSTER